MRRLGFLPLLLAGLLPMPVAASPIFGDGFEACCMVGGTVSGLEGRSVTLRLQAGAVDENLVISTDGGYHFVAALAAGVGYSVSVSNQPSTRPDCAVANAEGVMPATAVDNVNVHCSGGLLWDSGQWGDGWQ